MVATAIAIIGAAVAVSGTVKANKAAKAANVASVNRANAQQKAQNLQARRQRRAAIRSNILNTARSRASAQAAGTSQGSGIAGGVGSAASNLGSALGFGAQMSGLGQRATMFGNQASTLQAKSQRYSNIAQLGTQMASFGLNNSGAINEGAADVKSFFKA